MMQLEQVMAQMNVSPSKYLGQSFQNLTQNGTPISGIGSGVYGEFGQTSAPFFQKTGGSTTELTMTSQLQGDL